MYLCTFPLGIIRGFFRFVRKKGGEKMAKTKALFNKLSFFALSMAVAVTFSVFSPNTASAAWKKAGITPNGSIENSGIYDDLDSLIYLIMAIGGFWIIGCIVFAGLRLSSAQTNPQMRTQGFIGLAMALIGLFIIVKAYDIAGFVAGFGN